MLGYRIMRAASQIALFLFLGGPVGGAATAAMLSVYGMVVSGDSFELIWVAQFPLMLVIGAFFGIILGIPAAMITGIAYTSFPFLRRAAPIMVIGAIISAIEGYVLSSALYVRGDAPIEHGLAFAGVLAVAGAVAALVCHVYLEHIGPPD